MRRIQDGTDDHLGGPNGPVSSLRSATLILAVPPTGAVVKYSVLLFGCIRGIRSLPEVFRRLSGTAGSHPSAER